MMLSSVLKQQKRITAAGEYDASKIKIVKAKDYQPGHEGELLEAVHALLYSSTGVLTHKVSTPSDPTSGWFPSWNDDNDNNNDDDTIQAGNTEEEKKCDMEYNEMELNLKSKNSEEWTPNEMDGIVDSMSFVLEVFQDYQAKAHNAAREFLDEQSRSTGTSRTGELTSTLEEQVAEVEDKNSDSWNLKHMAKDMSSADFLLGGLMPNTSMDEYPEGSESIFPMTSLGPATDMFLESMSSLLGGMTSTDGKTGQKGKLALMDSKIKYLHDVESVNETCIHQIEELDTIIGKQGDKTMFDLQESTSMGSANSVLTRDVEENAASPPLNAAAVSYIMAAREKLAQYASLANTLLQDEVKCMVSTYTCAPEKCGDSLSASELESDQDDVHMFQGLRKHFNSDAYNMDFKEYLAAETENDMQTMILDTLHSSLFLRNVGDKCKGEIRVHVGKEVSVSICNLVMDVLLNSKREHRFTEWGALLFSRHVRALHAYAYEFCRATEGTHDLLSKVEVSSFDAKPMDANWERLFSALDVLKLEKLEDYTSSKLHPLFTAKDARRILRLRTEFDDDAIEARVPLVGTKVGDDE